RSTVMRPRTIPILAAVALSLAVPSHADARPRFGPALLLGVVAGSLAMFGGFRHSARHPRRSATHHSVRPRSARAARIERRGAAGGARPAGGGGGAAGAGGRPPRARAAPRR